MAIIGIDLGTTNSVLSYYKDNQAVTIPIEDEKLLPSVIHLSESGFVVGKVAKNLLVLEPENTVSSVKRKMGQDLTLVIGDKALRPEELSSIILKKIKTVAIQALNLAAGQPVQAVITVPAYFTEEQRQATRQAAEMANLKVERIINEPTAAALAFGMSSMDEAVYAIYDLGGGTFDISVIESDEGLVEVIATTGNNELGGDDFDEAFAAYIWSEFLNKNELTNIEKDRRTHAKLVRLAELSKIELSENIETSITESFFLNHKGTNYHLDMTVRRSKFESLIEKDIQQTVQLLQKAVQDAKLKMEDVDGILLVGGSSRIPLVTSLIEKATGILPQLIGLPDEAVAHGAAVQGAIIDKIDVETILVDITPYSLGIGVMDDISYQDMMMNVRNFENPEDFKNNLGAECLIRKNTPVPARNKKMFSAMTPFQEKFQIKVFQGEKSRFGENKKIGECLLKIENPPQDPEIEVEFHLDINGILNLSAVEISTKEKITATFKSSRGQRIRKELLEDFVVVSEDESENLLINRAQKILDEKKLAEEDKQELQEILERYKTEQSSEDAAEGAKTKLLDLLYYLESK